MRIMLNSCSAGETTGLDVTHMVDECISQDVVVGSQLSQGQALSGWSYRLGILLRAWHVGSRRGYQAGLPGANARADVESGEAGMTLLIKQ